MKNRTSCRLSLVACLIPVFLTLGGVFVFAPGAYAEIIPADRRIDWVNTTIGVPGGIPTNRANCVTTACSTLYDNKNVTATPINAAIASVPDGTSAVVRSPAGTYTISSAIATTKNK